MEYKDLHAAIVFSPICGPITIATPVTTAT